MTTTKGLNAPLTHPPLAHEVKSLRRHVETAMKISTTAAQSICAGATYSHLRTWQRWEEGERNMPVSAWELALIKLSDGYLRQPDTNELKAKVLRYTGIDHE